MPILAGGSMTEADVIGIALLTVTVRGEQK